MSVEAFERREQILKLRAKILQSEQKRIDRAKTMSIQEIRQGLRERINAI